MPHFVIECSESILKNNKTAEIINTVYEVAESSGLFALNDIKVRLLPFTHYRLGNGKEDFLHIFAYIMQGRTIEQKASLSNEMIVSLNKLLPTLDILSMNISDFESATYCNKALIDPMNVSRNRHFSTQHSEDKNGF
jgi:5-carboxymethyl-2-hydroxymuconate isomerase